MLNLVAIESFEAKRVTQPKAKACRVECTWGLHAAASTQALREPQIFLSTSTTTITTTTKRAFTMAGSNTRAVEVLQRPEPLQEVLAQDKHEDCLTCRITGNQKAPLTTVKFLSDP